MRVLHSAILAGLLLACSLLVLGVLSLRAGRVQGAAPAGQNGDVNGDGDLDISDPIYLLVHLFRSGPPPIACADSPDLVARVTELEEKVEALEAAGIEERLGGVEAATAMIQENLDILRADARRGSNKLALFALALHGQAFHDCQENGEPVTLPVSFDFETSGTPTVVRNGEVSGEKILFETDREADLVFEMRTAAPGRPVSFYLDDDPRPLFSFQDNGTRRAFALDVPPGQHAITATVVTTCSTGIISEGVMGIDWLVVQYLE